MAVNTLVVENVEESLKKDAIGKLFREVFNLWEAFLGEYFVHEHFYFLIVHNLIVNNSEIAHRHIALQLLDIVMTHEILNFSVDGPVEHHEFCPGFAAIDSLNKGRVP
jgi:hypothetical protein